MSSPSPAPFSDAALANGTRVFLGVLGLAIGVVFVLSLPELKRYIKISSM